MAGIPDIWVGYLRRHRLESQDEQVAHQGSRDGERPDTSRSRARPIWSRSSDAEMMIGRPKRAPLPPPHSEDTEHKGRHPPSRSRARPALDCTDFKRRPRPLAGRLWTPDSGPAVAPRAPARQRLAAPTQGGSSNDDHDISDDTSRMKRQPEARPISQDQLVTEVKGIFAGLVMVETICIEVDNAQSCNTDANSKLNNQQWLAMTQLSSSLLNILGNNESAFDNPKMELQEALGQIEAILAGLQLRFRRKYDELSRKKGLMELVFEFPDNIRHICTTMPWTISPVLVVLWGVCWMFIIGPRDAGHEKPTATVPTIALSPATCGFHNDTVCTSTGAGHQSSVVPGFDHTEYGSLATIENSLYGDAGIVGDQFGPLDFIWATPQGPNFLTAGVAMSGGLDNFELPKEDFSRLAESVSSAIPPNPVPQACHGTDQQDSTGPAVNAVLTVNEDQETSSTNSSEQGRPRFACPDCNKTFARPSSLKRHRAETHLTTTRAPQEALTCPNPGCKRSEERFAFKRPGHLKRHLGSCKHDRDTPNSQPERESAQSTSGSTSPGGPHPPAALQAEAAKPSGGKKRPQLEDEDDGSNDDSLVREMMKEHSKISKEVEEKKRRLEVLEEMIRIWRKRDKEDA